MKGKLATWKIENPVSAFKIDAKDCSKPLEETNSDDDALYAEVMAEMEEEEAARKA